MAAWREIDVDAPEFAARVRERFDVGTNKTIATLRRDGSPRISGTELRFTDDGRVTLGMMDDSMKLHDVRRDPRVAIHSPTFEPPEDPTAWAGDAKLAGVLVEDATSRGEFTLDVTEAVLTRVGTPADHLVIESWHPAHGWRRRTRR